MSTSERDGDLVASRPSGHLPAVHTWTLDSAAELSGLRAGIRRAVNGAVGRAEDVPLDDVPEHMCLVATELATNGLEHGAPPVQVRLHADGSTFVLDVADRDLRDEPRVAGDRPFGRGGFGLVIARRLAVDVGWYRSPEAKHVWAQFTLPDEALPAAPGA
ncbi:ATP-binding protein [Cellulomonas sp. NPDC057328]|uniref:ATP-binding protein n=1 Tax=Cellulomonas sp. NPDC057328 TaxID=3346101 RepID=UPI0036333500